MLVAVGLLRTGCGLLEDQHSLARTVQPAPTCADTGVPQMGLVGAGTTWQRGYSLPKEKAFYLLIEIYTTYKGIVLESV